MAKDRVTSEGAFSNEIRRTVDRNFADVSICTTSLTKNADTTLANVAGVTTDAFSLTPGTYRFLINIVCTSGASGGLKAALKQNDGLTLTSIDSTSKAFTASAVAVSRVTSTTDAASLVASTSAVIKCEIEGVLVVATAGTLQLQAAQNASNGTDTVILTGTRMEITRVGA